MANSNIPLHFRSGREKVGERGGREGGREGERDGGMPAGRVFNNGFCLTLCSSKAACPWRRRNSVRTCSWS